MLLLINNSTDGNVLSYIFQVRKTLKDLNIPFIERNKIDETIIENKHLISGIILLGSPMTIINDPMTNFNFDIYYLLHLNVPVLGICFGCQLLTVLNGGSLIDRGKLFCETVPVETANHMLFKNMIHKELKFCFSNLPVAPKKSNVVKEIAWININGKTHGIAFEFKKNKMFGILGHPEIHEYSRIIYKNFATFCGERI